MKDFNKMFFITGSFNQTPGLHIPINEKTLGIDGINSNGEIQVNSFIPINTNPVCDVYNSIVFIVV